MSGTGECDVNAGLFSWWSVVGLIYVGACGVQASE